MPKRPLGLVAYGSSGDEAEDPETEENSQPKRRKLPPLSSTVIVQVPADNPSLHQGRTRTVPHVDGQYASYVYVPLKVPRRSSLYEFLREVIATARVDAPTLHPIGISVDGAPEAEGSSSDAELRISLTRPIYLRAHQREEVKTAIRAIARRTTRFLASFAQFAELTNDERTRTFLTLEIGAGHVELKALSNALIPILEQYRQKLFYDTPRFHASIAWALLSPPAPPQDTPSPRAAPQNATSVKEEDPSPTPPGQCAKSATPSPHHGAAPPNSEPVMSVQTARSDTNTAPGSPAEYRTIARLPTPLLATLQTQHAATLRAKHVGVFDVDEVCVRIGRDVSRWRLGG